MSVSESSDKTLRIWDRKTGKEVGRLAGLGGGITGLAVLPGGRRVLTGDYDGTIRLLDLDEGKEVRRWSHGTWVCGLAVSPDGRFALVSGHGKLKDRLWDVETGKEVRDFLRDQEGPVAGLGWQSGGVFRRRPSCGHGGLDGWNPFCLGRGDRQRGEASRSEKSRWTRAMCGHVSGRQSPIHWGQRACATLEPVHR